MDRSAKIISGMKIELWRNGKQTITAEEDVKFEVEKVQDANRDSGYREVKQAGENGKKNVTYEVEMKMCIRDSRAHYTISYLIKPIMLIYLHMSHFILWAMRIINIVLLSLQMPVMRKSL